ncbi:MAG: hypothetical protein EPO68_14190 [Planctomycetota bacterium]|nr:MAG: hypothetical protein EPO68_14190 [Planctomycetota bacterium]
MIRRTSSTMDRMHVSSRQLALLVPLARLRFALRTRMRVAHFAPALFACVLLALASCGDAPKAKPNVLLITVDTLRADHLGCYGYARDTTPNLDAFAKESALFERAYSMAPFTAPSHASLFTGMYQISHGVQFWGQKLAASAPSYPERFAKAGYRTAAFYNHPGMKSCDLERGFEHRELRVAEPGDPSIDGLLAWIDGRSAQGGDVGGPGASGASNANGANGAASGAANAKPFAAWLHLWDVHRPYGWRDWREIPDVLKPLFQRRELTFAFEEQRYGGQHDVEVGRGEQFYNVHDARQRQPISVAGSKRVLDERDWQFVQDRYDGGVRYADALLGKLFKELKDRGLYENTVIVVTSDHGETLRERSGCWFTHDPYLYEETLRVPLIIRVPGGAGSSHRELVRGIDVLPTLLEYADLPAAGVQGHSLMPALRGEKLPPQVLWARTQTLSAKESERKIEAGKGWLEERECISDGAWKLIVDRETNTAALYDLVNDPGETKNALHQPDAQPHAQRLQKALDEFGKLQKALESGVELDEAMRELLDNLGY